LNFVASNFIFADFILSNFVALDDITMNMLFNAFIVVPLSRLSYFDIQSHLEVGAG
jgi:hypothetical protein